ncbi:response regulator [Gordonia pseudamarae]|jgi:DNA-binding NarL/FixJ family response regulator|uniref:Response regulator n=1 Tax=Gordonia pseudamarae TaxID=2831662 RepID=A0ABX6IL93_9ACTN|nr:MULTISPECIES: response regulator transcription factor [Gordonia]MBD0023120.1 response regulator transcription factor [Gordonia sp. (in: high G+C Gram-positive bacteria)]QHN27251.1 response regulator [Gordonia pseudamarae]QHN36134.1 response regulator [Gordonia pseudamarae]
MIRIVLADDHPVVRAGLRAMLAGDPDLDLIGEAATPDDAVALVTDLRPDVVLMDLQFGTAETGADATRRIRALPAPPAVLVLTNYDTDGDILGAVEAGASGYLLKDAPPDELIAAIRAAAAGETALAPAIAGRLLARMRSPRPGLSTRELEVLRLVAGGATNNDIATRLHISEATVKSHLVHIYTKLGVSSRTAAVATARDSGLFR